MRIIFLAVLLFSSMSYAEIGKVIKAEGTSSFLIRGLEKKPLSQATLELGDVIETGDITAAFQVFPLFQVISGKNSKLKISDYNLKMNTKDDRSWFSLELLKGTLVSKVAGAGQMPTETKVDAPGMSVVSNDGEFMMTITASNDVELDVLRGQVAVSSPFIQSFVPEIVRAKEGLTFSAAKKSFIRRKMAAKASEYSFFDTEVKKNWLTRTATTATKKNKFKKKN